jgi:hypothetical protein
MDSQRLKVAKEAVLLACKATTAVSKSISVKGITKVDNSPVTGPYNG